MVVIPSSANRFATVTGFGIFTEAVIRRGIDLNRSPGYIGIIKSFILQVLDGQAGSQ